MFVVIVCVSTDIGGYIFGKTFKGPKLTKISPKKTYSGMIGGYILSFIVMLMLIKYVYPIGNDYTISLLNIFILLILISTISQIGDVIVSLF